MKAVLDSSVLVSAFLTPGSTSGALLRLALDGRYRLCLSLEILDEVARVLRSKSRLRDRYRYGDEEAVRYVQDLLAIAEVVTELPAIPAASRDPDDDHVLSAALAAGAEVIVTGDDDLLVLGEYERIRILGVRGFLKEVT